MIQCATEHIVNSETCWEAREMSVNPEKDDTHQSVQGHSNHICRNVAWNSKTSTLQEDTIFFNIISFGMLYNKYFTLITWYGFGSWKPDNIWAVFFFPALIGQNKQTEEK